MTLILSIFLLLFVALLLGELFEQFNFPAIIGELLAGLILGPAVLGLVTMNPIFNGIAEISLFFIILLIGIEVTTETLRNNYGQGMAFTITSFVAPLIVMILVSQFLLGLSETQAVVISLAVATPSISIVSVLLKNFKLLKVNAGHVFLSSVIITDIIAFGTLSTIISPERIYLDVFGIAIFLAILFLADLAIRNHSEFVVAVFERLHARERGEKVIFGMIIVAGLVISSLLELIGITFVLGAFFAGIIINEVVVGEHLHGMLISTLTRLNDSFFIPVFFSIAGVEIILPGGDTIFMLAVLMLLAAGIGGPLNYYLSEKILSDVHGRTAAGVLGSRGSVGIIIASVAYGNGIIDSSLYSLAIFATLILSLAFTPLVRKGDISLPD